ncbi:MAG: hypothetical protein WA816_10495 [Bacteroidales bacterium]
MKKLLKFSVLVIAVAIDVSQSDLKAQAFKNGDMVGNLGFGFGWYGYSYYGAGVSSLPAISLSLEKGIKDISSISSVLTLGGIVGIKHASWSYYGDNGSYNDIIIAARGALHADLFKVKNLDTYAGLAIGARIHNEKFPYLGYTINNYTNPLFALYIGGRYYFSNQFAGFGEIGYGLGYLTLGLSYKFN